MKRASIINHIECESEKKYEDGVNLRVRVFQHFATFFLLKCYCKFNYQKIAVSGYVDNRFLVQLHGRWISSRPPILFREKNEMQQ